MKRIINTIFIITILLTVIGFGLFVLKQPNDDVFYNEMDGIIFWIVLTPVLVLESEIYNICVYLFTEEKKRVKTILKISSLAISVLFLLSVVFLFYVTTNKYGIVPFVVLLLYVILKVLSSKRK